MLHVLLRVLSLTLLGLFLGVGAESFPNYTCTPEGPKFTRPVNLKSSTFVQEAFRNLTELLDKAVNGSIKAGWVVENATFSLAVVNMEDKKPLWEYHYRGSASPRGVKKVDGDTQYMIGSLSKLISDMMLLRSGMDMYKPVTTYVPQLNNSNSKIKWNEITVASLAEHLSGIPANYGFSDKYDLQERLEKLGFPHVPREDYAKCGVEALNARCTKAEILDAMVKIPPFAAPYRRLVYSQLAFTISSYALSGFSGGKSYRQSLKDLIVSPLGLTNTGASPGNDSRAAIPIHDSWWGQDIQEETPGSGLYSSSNDLCTIMHSILNRSVLPESTILHWLKPSAGMASNNIFSGMPWEMVRASNMTPDYPQIVEFHNKGGSSYGYNSQLSLVDQYGVGIISLTAGDPYSAALIPTIMYGWIVPALEEETRLQTQSNYVKTFSSREPVDRQGNSTMTVKMNVTMNKGPGLIISNLTRGPFDILSTLPLIYQEGFGNLTKLPVTLINRTRIYPTDLRVRERLGDGREVIKEDWRMNWDSYFTFEGWNGTELFKGGDTDAKPDACGSWVNSDWSNYAGHPIDRVVFVKDAANGNVIGIELPWLRANLTADS